MSLQVVTFGCRLNAFESEQVRARAQQDGLTDAVIFNTCAVTGEAVRQARQAIRRARRERPGARLIVTGCAAQIDPDQFAAMPEVDAVIGNSLKAAPGAYAPDEPRVRVSDIFAARENAPHLIDGLKDHSRAWVEIQNGCDHRCTFCVIPYGRGNSRSAGAGEVVAQVRRLVDSGVNEVVLTGVDLTSWGADLPGAPTLGNLIARILKLVPELPRLRLSSIDAAEIDAALLRCLAEEERLAPHLHLSLQHGDDLILKRMKRRHSRADAIRLTEQVRTLRPDVAFGADLIAGFPTETGAAFENALSLVDACGLSFLHVFPFSPRPGTPAARMPAVPRALVKARAARLREEGALALMAHLQRQTGRTVAALIERGGFAHAPDFTEIAVEGAGEPGCIAPVRLTGHDGRRALGVPGMTQLSTWADDELLKPWRRGKLDLPFTTGERTAEEQGRRLLAYLAGSAVIIFVIIFGMLVFFGMVPELYADPKVHWTEPRDPWIPLKLSGGAVAIGVIAIAVIAGPLISSAPRSLGHPWTFAASEDGLTLTTSDGETHTGRWADWRLVEYDWAPVLKGVPVITAFVLGLGEREFRVKLLSLKHQRTFMRAVAQKVAV